jgi:hypothetical protein
VDIAKEAIMRSAAALSDEDYLGIVTFDEQAHWTLDVKHLVSTGALEQAIGSFKAEGQTNMVSGVNAAYQGLKGVNAKQKHIILMTDGWVRTGDLTGLVEEMRQQGITLSVIAAGEGSAEYLRALAEAGGGRYYPATDMMNVPDIFLKETVKSVGQYIVEEPFYPLPASPSPLMKGIDDNDLPALAGYNGTSPKGTARLDLLTKRGDPLLASWQYGLGRSIVWTSDLNGRWSGQWVAWKDFARFAAQSVNWLLPSSQADGLTAKISLTDEGALIHLDAEDKAGRPINDLSAQVKLISPELTTSEAQMQQVGVGQYEVKLPVEQPGTYLVWLGANQKSQPMGQMTLGLVVPYSPEYRSGGTNIGLLDELARVTGGTALEDPVKAFVHNLPANDSAKEIWRVLLIIAALLFPIDVAIRRLTLSRRDWQTASDWVAQQLPNRREATQPKGEPQVLSALFNARNRARQRTQADRPAQPGSPTSPLHTQPPQTQTAAQHDPRSGESTPQPPSPQENQPAEDSFARLREAKKRARRP